MLVHRKSSEREAVGVTAEWVVVQLGTRDRQSAEQHLINQVSRAL